MDIKKSKASSIVFHLLILCFVTVQVHAASGRLSLFTKNSGPLIADPAHPAWSDSGNGPVGWRSRTGGSGIGDGFVMVLAGVGGNIVGIYAGAYIGFVIPSGSIWGILAGSTLGSALGVYAAGSSGGRGGKFSAALGGSLVGELAAIGLAFALHDHERLFMPGLLILPPLGAAIAFNGSRRSRDLRAGNGLLSLEDGRLGIGIPDVQVRPLYVPGTDARPGLQFKVKVFSVEL